VRGAIPHFSTRPAEISGSMWKNTHFPAAIEVGARNRSLLVNIGAGSKCMQDKDLDIVVQSTRGTKAFSFPKQTKISEVTSAAVRAFEFAPGDRFELALASNPGDVLQPERPLVSYHVTDGTTFILTSIGGGV